jgi:chloramphenicol-sensitive protein RarD
MQPDSPGLGPPKAIASAFGAYFLWGLLPAFLALFHTLPALQVVAWRIVWTVPWALGLAALMAGWSSLRADRATLARLALSGLLIGANWMIYVWAVGQGRVVETSLGYFINPLINVAFGVVLFREKLGRLQMLALGLAALGVLNQTVMVGAFPWVALALAVSFALYGLVRKTTVVAPAAGLFWEAMLLAPLAVGTLVMLAGQGHPVAGADTRMALLLMLTGPATAIPLILFAAGARHLPFATLGLLQYVAPTLQFTTGILMGEPFTSAHAITFALIWSGLVVYTYASLRAAKQEPRQGSRPAGVE